MREVLSALPLAAVLSDARGTVLLCNDLAAELFGGTTEGLVGLAFPAIPEGGMRDALVHALGGEKSSFEGRYEVAERGISLDVRAEFCPVLGEDGALAGVMGTFQDVGERRRAEQEAKRYRRKLEALRDIGVLATSSLDLGEVLAGILEGATKAAGASVGMIFLRDPGADVLRWGASLGLSDAFVEDYRDQRLKLGEGLSGVIASSGVPIFIPEDSSHDPRVERHVVEREGLHSFIGVPIRTETEIVGVMNVLTRPPDTLSEHDVPLVAAMGSHVGSSVLNAQLHAQLKKARAELASERRLIAALIDALADTFLVFATRTGRAHLWNKVFQQVSGYSPEEIAAMGAPSAYFDPQDQERLLAVTNRPGCGQSTLELDFVTKDQRRIPQECSIAWVDNPGDERRYVICVGRDLTRRRRMQEEVLRLQKLESVGTLAGGIAHDFNNLLAAVLGSVSLAKSLVGEKNDVTSLLSEAEEACLRAKDLTQQLLAFSRGGAPVKRWVALPELLRQTCGFVIRGSRAICDLSLQDGLWDVELDEGQFARVLHNIVLNAIESMSEGGQIRVAAENVVLPAGSAVPLPDGSYVHVSVSDQGCGIPAGHLAKIFDPYFTTKQTGSGLGLAVSHTIVKNHGGHIVVESETGRGSTFRIYLPASPGDRPCRGPGVPVPRSDLHKKVLVMDDEEAVRKMMVAMLQHLACSVGTAADGTEALRMYEQAKADAAPFDLVVLDLTVPGAMGGKETLRELLKIDPNVRAVVASGYSSDLTLARFRAEGFVGCLLKPFTLEELRVSLERAMREPCPARTNKAL
jgi:PAS domain S-box-containing protein